MCYLSFWLVFLICAASYAFACATFCFDVTTAILDSSTALRLRIFLLFVYSSQLSRAWSIYLCSRLLFLRVIAIFCHFLRSVASVISLARQRCSAKDCSLTDSFSCVRYLTFSFMISLRHGAFDSSSQEKFSPISVVGLCLWVRLRRMGDWCYCRRGRGLYFYMRDREWGRGRLPCRKGSSVSIPHYYLFTSSWLVIVDFVWLLLSLTWGGII